MENLEKEISNPLEFLGKVVKVKVDRRKGSTHPKHGFVYEVNYGFVSETLSPDGEELDTYVLGVDEPLAEFEGRCVAVIHRLNDDDDKLVIVPLELLEISDEEIRQQTKFQEKFLNRKLSERL